MDFSLWIATDSYSLCGVDSWVMKSCWIIFDDEKKVMLFPTILFMLSACDGIMNLLELC